MLPVIPDEEKQGARASCSPVVSIDTLQRVTITHPSTIPGRTTWDLLLNKLWEINSFDALHRFFDDLSLILEKHSETPGSDGIRSAKSTLILLTTSSPLGAFVRRSQLEFTRLQFHDGITLWKSFVAYRSPTFAAWGRRHLEISTNIDANLEEGSYEPEGLIKNIVYGDLHDLAKKHVNISTEDLEKLLEYQVDQMQSTPFPC